MTCLTYRRCGDFHHHLDVRKFLHAFNERTPIYSNNMFKNITVHKKSVLNHDFMFIAWIQSSSIWFLNFVNINEIFHDIYFILLILTKYFMIYFWFHEILLILTKYFMIYFLFQKCLIIVVYARFRHTFV